MLGAYVGNGPSHDWCQPETLPSRLKTRLHPLLFFVPRYNSLYSGFSPYVPFLFFIFIIFFALVFKKRTLTLVLKVTQLAFTSQTSSYRLIINCEEEADPREIHFYLIVLYFFHHYSHVTLQMTMDFKNSTLQETIWWSSQTGCEIFEL